MKKLQKLASVLMVAILATVGISGCSAEKKEESVASTQAVEGTTQASDVTESTEKIEIKISAINTVSWAPVFIAETEGFFEAQGLEVEFTTPGGPKGFQAMHAGDCQFCMLSQEPLLVAQESGMKSSVIATMLNSRVYGIIGSTDLEDLSQLKGTTIFASDPGSAPYVFVCNALKEAGLDPMNDVTMIQVADQNAGMQAFINGEVAAAFVNMSNLPALGEFEYKILADSTDPVQCAKYLGSEEFPGEMLCTSTEYAAENPEICQKVVNAVIDASKWIAENSDEAVAASLYSIFGSLDEKVIAEEIALIRDKFSTTGFVSETGQKAVIDMCVNAGLIQNEIPYADVIDMTFVNNYGK